MDYLLILLFVIVFVLGTSKTTEFTLLLSDVQRRRNLILRIAGFFAMSAWVHALPSILLMIYMRQNGILAPETFSLDSPRATVIGLYAVSAIAIGVFAILAPQIARLRKGYGFKLYSIDTFVTAMSFIGIMYTIGHSEGIPTALLTAVVAIAVGGYVLFSYTASFEDQLKYFWAPFLVIAAVSFGMMILAPAGVEKVVAQQLRSFTTGGGAHVVIVHKNGEQIHGKLVLLTGDTAYVDITLPREKRVIELSEEETEVRDHCTLRIPVADAVIVTNPHPVLGPLQFVTKSAPCSLLQSTYSFFSSPDAASAAPISSAASKVFAAASGASSTGVAASR